MNTKEFQFNKEEIKVIKKLNTPVKIQEFLNSLEINFEETGETCMSPRMVLKTKKAHCIEAAMFAAAVMRFHGHPPLILDFETTPEDEDHVVALFKKDNHWGAISKTNHAVLRYREPIYKSIRELAMSYFHEYYLFANGKKTLRKISKPINLNRFNKKGWMTSEDNIWYIPNYLCDIPHTALINRSQINNLRRVDPIEITAGKLVEYQNPNGNKELP
ncbi:MAG: hypothetical protein AABX03_03235 [Nanoarchaeota archaeon]